MVRGISSCPVVIALSLLLLSACDSSVMEPESLFTVPKPQFSMVSFSPYTAIDLGTLGGTTSYAYQINDAGQVAGSGQLPIGESNAFLWDPDGGMTNLGTLGTNSYSLGINETGQVAGSFWVIGGGNRAFHWNASDGMIELSFPECSNNLGMDINNSGQIVGSCLGPLFRGFIWDPEDGFTNVGTLGLLSDAEGLNDAGQVVGYSHLGPGLGLHAYLWDRASGMIDLGTLGGLSSRAYEINNAGQVVGLSLPAGGNGSADQRAFLWEAGTGMINLGTLGGYSIAFDINEVGQVVGQSQNVDGHFRAVLWDPQNGMIDLGTLGGAAGRAVGINNLGQIVGDSETPTGEIHATLWVLLTPIDAISEVVDIVQQLLDEAVINEGQAHSLTNKLNLATAMVNDGKITPAINKIGAFINQVEAFMSGEFPILTQEQGQALIDGAAYVISGLGG
jgi:probable HAF family extracellular repeat protein